MDNKIFNVNGRSFHQFKLTIELMLTNEYNDKQGNGYDPFGTGVRGYKITKKGLILYLMIRENVKNISEIINIKELEEKYNIKESIRKYKLLKLNEDVEGRVTVPIDILTYALWEWVQNYDGEIEYGNFEDTFIDSDVSIEKGFRIYVDKWGHVNNENGLTIDHYTIFALRPVYCWYGK